MDGFNIELDLGNFDIGDINISLDDCFDNRHIRPKYYKPLQERKIKYEHAEEMADSIKEIEKNDRVFTIVSGNFIFGDLIEALFVKNNWHALEMIISTLSMSQENIDSLSNLLTGGYVDLFDLIVSDFFYSHERRKLIKYAYEKLDIDNRFQLAVAGTHCKTCQFVTDDLKYIVIHGSSNLRSSGNIEQLMIEENEDLYRFNREYQKQIIDTYFTIKKPVRRAKLWQTITAQPEERKRIKVRA